MPSSGVLQEALLYLGLAVILSWMPVAALHADEPASPAPIDQIKQSNEALRRFVLDNGMIGLIKEDHSAPVVAIQIWVGAGSIHEAEFLGGGLSHYIEHMIFKGTPTRKTGDISKQIHDEGGDINAYTAQDRTVFLAHMPARSWPVAVDVLADAVMNASFPDDEWEREREVISREFAMGKDDPGRTIAKMLWSTAYRVHPYRVPVIGHEDIFRTMNRTNLLTFFRRNYVPDNMIVAMVGDVSAVEAEARLREAFKSFGRRPRAPQTIPEEPPQMAPRFARETGDYEISRLEWVYPTVALDHPDTPALDVLAAIVGGGRSSRLNEDVKEKQKLVFSIGAWSATPAYPGLFGISAAYEPAKEQAVLSALQKQVDLWTATPFTTNEIEKARRQVLVGALSDLQTMEGQASSYASGEFYAGDPRFSERYLAAIQGVTPESITEVARRYFTPDHRTLVILSPKSAEPAASGAPAPSAATNIARVLLPNRIPLLVREDHRLPFVYLCAVAGGGLLSENATNNGITQLMSDLLTRGTKTRSAQEVARTVEALGGSLSAFCGRNSYGLQARCLSQDAELFLDLLADSLIHADFPQEEIEKQKTLQLAGIRQQREQPFFIADEALRTTLFAGHPYRWNVAGSEESVAGLNRGDLNAHQKRLLTSSNLVLAIFGDIAEARAQQLAARFFDAMPDGPAPDLSCPAPQAVLPSRVKKREPRQQTVMLLGFPGVDLRDERVDALNVIADALSGLSSDLGMEVREKRGLVYYIGAFQRPGLQPGLFALYAGAREDTVEEVERIMEEQLARIAEKGLREEEMRRTVKQMLTDLDSRWQDNSSLAQIAALDELYGLGYRYSLSLPERLEKVTPAAIQKAAREIFMPSRRAIAVVLPESDEKKETNP